MTTVLIIAIFILGYVAIAFESWIKVDKAATAILTAVFCWSILALGGVALGVEDAGGELLGHLNQTASIVFFLMGAMAIVELIDVHNGFDIITRLITTTKKVKLLIIFSLLTFFLSAILDNLTTTIVMVALLRKILKDRNDLLLFGSMVIIAANAGGAFSPIGDVTTIMLWIGNRVTAANIIMELFIPSLVCIVIPLVAIGSQLKGHIATSAADVVSVQTDVSKKQQKLILFLGVGCLLFTPIFKTFTHLPPFLGILFGVGVVGLASEILHRRKPEEEKEKKSLVGVLRRIDMMSILFFLGILLAVNALEVAGILHHLSIWLMEELQSYWLINIAIGLMSSIFDNVPLVAGMMGMYSLADFPTDHMFWELLSFCAGTGGSILIIGSAAGVAAMGLLKIDFIWYLKKISLWALLGYFSGVGVLYLMYVFA